MKASNQSRWDHAPAFKASLIHQIINGTFDFGKLDRLSELISDTPVEFLELHYGADADFNTVYTDLEEQDARAGQLPHSGPGVPGLAPR
jgi:hypothetical protein